MQTNLPLQAASIDIWARKYQLKDKMNQAVDLTVYDTMKRVAQALAACEKSEELQQYWEKKFLYALEHGAVPAGRIVSNAGAEAHKPATSTINCTVSGTITDSMDGILAKVHEAGLTLKAGCGIGYEFSTLRPRGAYVAGAGAYTSGALSFMDIFDKMCFTVSSAGGRRGAQMATFDISHPDVVEFIQAKREDGRLRQFNLSLLISREFIEAVNNDGEWALVFPITTREAIAADTPIIWKPYASTEGLVTNEEGLVAHRVYRTLPARELWDIVMRSTYDFAEPGFILIDRANEMNNNWWCENIRASNPCGEQVLPPYGACLLGSINLTHYVDYPFTAKASFNFERFDEVVAIFTRMLDNVVEINGLPLEEQRREIERKRRHGMGFFGLGSALVMMGLRYDSAEACELTEKITQSMALTGWKQALLLAREKGPAPIMAEDFTVTLEMLRLRPEMQKEGWKVGDTIKGSVLHAKYSRYMQQIATLDADLVNTLAEVGARFTHHTSIAPTGTIALSLGNNASNGIEPSFAHQYSRNVIIEGKKTKEKVEVYSYENLLFRQLKGDATPLPAQFMDAADISPFAHVDIQAAAQKWIDSSISKTINVPTDYDYDSFKNIYLYAYEKGLKGCTTFRFNPAAFQGVLVKEKDLANTQYIFDLADGSKVTVSGNETIEYDGETHSAANLYDALKEGYYGKF